MAPRKRTAARRASEKAKELLKQNKVLQLDDSEELSSGLQSDSDVSDVVISSEQSSAESCETSEEDIPLKAKRSKEALVQPSDESEGEVGDKKQPTLLTTNRKRLMKKKKRAGIKCRRKRGSSSRKVQTERFEWQQWEDELQDWGPLCVDGDDSFDNLPFEKGPLDAKEPPSELLMPLLPFQKEWLSWSMKQEASDIRGGILADEMGMGKTIQAISLILTNKSSPLSCVSPHAQKLHQVLPQVKATLVVCPLVAVIQWRNELARYTKEGSVKVLVYHGGKRCKDVSELAEYDIVLTTYSIVELEHRLGILPPKEHCKWCGKLFYPDRMNIHLRFFCGPDAKKTEKQAKQVKKKPGVSKSMPIYSKGEDGKSFSKGRYVKGKGKQKIVERPSLTSEFLEKGFENECSTVITRGKKRKVSEEELAGALTVAIESSEKASELHFKGSSILHAVRWNRIILDEAHYIKDRRCSTAKAVFALQSNFKWALSGTPLQNRVGELYSLVRFLDIKPYSYYYCKKCNCKSLDYSFGKEWRKCDLCKHSPLHHFCWWNKVDGLTF